MANPVGIGTVRRQTSGEAGHSQSSQSSYTNEWLQLSVIKKERGDLRVANAREDAKTGANYNPPVQQVYSARKKSLLGLEGDEGDSIGIHLIRDFSLNHYTF